MKVGAATVTTAATPAAYRFAIVFFFVVLVATKPTRAAPSSSSSSFPAVSLTAITNSDVVPVSDGSNTNINTNNNIDIDIDITEANCKQPTTRTNSNSIDPLIQNSIDDISATIKEFYTTNDNHNQLQEERMLFHRRRRPFVTLSYAQSIDGKIALCLDDQQQENSSGNDDGNDNSVNDNVANHNAAATTSSNFAISGPESLRLTHALRSIHDAILVGGKTLAIDNPRLGNRLWMPKESPLPPLPIDDNDDANHNDNDGGSTGSSNQHGQPRPVVLDTHLHYTRMLGKTIRAKNPIVCCSQDAYDRAVVDGYGYCCDSTTSQEGGNGSGSRNNKSNENDNDDDNIDENAWDGISTTTASLIPSSVTLFPCKTTTTKVAHSNRRGGDQRVVLDLPDVLSGLYHTFGIRSVMVEGGASVLSQFVTSNNNVGYGDDNYDETFQNTNANTNTNGGDHLVDCLCVTISPKLLGTKGLASISSLPSIGAQGGGAGNKINTCTNESSRSQSQSRRLSALRCITLGEDCVLFSNFQRSSS